MDHIQRLIEQDERREARVKAYRSRPDVKAARAQAAERRRKRDQVLIRWALDNAPPEVLKEAGVL